MLTILSMPPSARKLPLRGHKKHLSTSTALDNKNDSHDSTSMSMNDLFLLFVKLIDNRLTEYTKNLHHDVDSKVHEWVDSTFQLLKSEHTTKLEDNVDVTASKFAESVNNKFNLLHFKVNSTIEIKLPAVDSSVS